MSRRIYRTVFLSAALVAVAFNHLTGPRGEAAPATPSLQLRFQPEQPRQGQTMAVFAPGTTDGAPPSPLLFHNKTYKFFLTGSALSSGDAPAAGQPPAYRALIGIPADIQAGTYALKWGNQEGTICVRAGIFGTQHIHLPKEKDNFLSSPGEEEAVDKAKATVSQQQLWTGPFLRPCKARITTTFGLRRMVNGHLLTDYFHSGIDYAGALGAPVKAAQAGRVIIAHKGWRLHGNLVAIDHGQGVVSFYLHLSKIAVHEGELVKPGQTIGLVGATGRATGPHLHFSLYVNGDATDPLDWQKRTI